ncbi:uncharacterized protein N7482_005521 [Penicillium canariense]|uniref:Uncharacterized protein n=1 Tax=Penicillium canariense TaxID=189055 RepID=A0A9W9I2J8_9EURO|nr:uncharacterized protein N7482_005521 [Penicillium canariense]KAJ5166740.1 hypothetical protein N7482_005521 [Penicillium canariense]
MHNRMLEIRLFHQYMTSTCQTLSQDGLSAYHMSITIPRMATSYPYLLDCILALSALHLATIEEDNRLLWLDAAVRYQSSACSGMSKILPDISPQHYEPAFVCSVLIFLFATGFPGMSPNSNRPSDPLSEVLEGRSLIAGSAMLFTRFYEIGVHAELNGWLCPPDTEENLAHKEENRSIMRSLENVRIIIEANQSPQKELYKDMWQLLHHAVQPWPKLGPQGGVFAWPFFVPEECISLLQGGDWVARIIFLHYSVSMRLMCHRWYVRDRGRRMVLATLEPLKEIPPEWTETISWMKEALGIDT